MNRLTKSGVAARTTAETNSHSTDRDKPCPDESKGNSNHHDHGQESDPYVAFFKLGKAPIFQGVLNRLSLTATRVYFTLAVRTFETPTGRGPQALGPRQCRISYASLNRLVGGRKKNQGASRRGLAFAVNELVNVGLVKIVQVGKGPGRGTVYYLPTARQWQETQPQGPARPLQPNPRDTQERLSRPPRAQRLRRAAPSSVIPGTQRPWSSLYKPVPPVHLTPEEIAARQRRIQVMREFATKLAAQPVNSIAPVKG